MSELIIPDVEITPDVPESVESVIETVENVENVVNYSEKNLAELVKLFEELVQNEDRMKMSKEAEAIKAAFYRRLQKEKADAGLVADAVAEDVDSEAVETEDSASSDSVGDNPFVEIEKVSRIYIIHIRRNALNITVSSKRKGRTILHLKRLSSQTSRFFLKSRRMLMRHSLNSARSRTDGGQSARFQLRTTGTSMKHISFT